MQPITAPAPQATPGPRPGRGRWIWRLSGVLTIGALTAPVGVWAFVPPHGSPAGMQLAALPARSFTVTTPVTALNVQSYGAPIRIAAAAGGPVKVTESVTYNAADAAPAVTHTDAHGLLTLAAPSCARSDCGVAFTVTVPPGVAVTAIADGGTVSVAGTAATTIDAGGGQVYAFHVSGPLTVNAEGGEVTVDQAAASATVSSGGGSVTVSGVAGPLKVDTDGGEITAVGAPAATLNSGGGPVYATGIAGPLTVTAEGGGVTVAGARATKIDSGGGPVTATTIRGPLSVTAEGGSVQADGVTGVLKADTGEGPLSAAGLGSATATVTAEGGDVTLGFTSAPQSVLVSTGGGQAIVSVPGGPYAVTTDSQGATSSVSVPASPAAARSISVSTDGGNLQIGPG